MENRKNNILKTNNQSPILELETSKDEAFVPFEIFSPIMVHLEDDSNQSEDSSISDDSIMKPTRQKECMKLSVQWMDIENEDKCTQEMGHTFITPNVISHKDFAEIINQNLSRLDTVQCLVLKKVSWFTKYPNLPRKLETIANLFQENGEESANALKALYIYNQINKDNFIRH